MRRTVLAEGLETWEVFATPGPSGFPRPARIGFRCVSNPGERTRTVETDGHKADAERLVAVASDDELRVLLGRARPLD